MENKLKARDCSRIAADDCDDSCYVNVRTNQRLTRVVPSAIRTRFLHVNIPHADNAGTRSAF